MKLFLFPCLVLLCVLVSPTDFTKVAHAEKERSWAVVIGINDYAIGINRLNYAVSDAVAVAGLLERQGFSVTTLYNDKATRKAILTELGTNLPIRVGLEDKVLIYFSGHGQDWQVPGGGISGYLLPVDTELGDLAGTAISMGRIREIANILPAKHVLFLIDSCFAGIGGQPKSSYHMGELKLKEITKEPGRWLMTAGTATQTALEVSEWGQGLFAHYVLEAIGEQRLADANKDGIIPVGELYTYVEDRVFQESNLRGNTQQPMLFPLSGSQGEFVFVYTQSTSHPIKNLPKEIKGKDGAPMVWMQAGEFRMGSRKGEGDIDEHLQHQISLDDFYIDRHEVTNQQFRQFVQTNDYKTGAEKEGKAWGYISIPAFGLTPRMAWKEILGANWQKPTGKQSVFESARDNHPVVSISWEDARAYCEGVGKRLPTEAEWEYSARAGTSTLYWWGNEPPPSSGSRVGNFADLSFTYAFGSNQIPDGYDDGYAGTAPVETYKANPWGLHDMSGNVWEWVADWYAEDYYLNSPQKNPQGPMSGERKVMRGGSWYNRPAHARSAVRAMNDPKVSHEFIGFRCAQNIP
ncbi:SUMF1/EgtB/PvdO family nonheme iron enzyme [Nitrospira sp. T9]|uniref:SUMF1/EgtB/PvdO family nonheme iron enzyme n=1 Tax=unclassified Nitrospira TaxID=2652172 RepID=UPI003F9D2E89